MVYIDEHIMDFDLEAALQQISEQRREQALRFRHELGQRTSVLAYLLLKKALRETFSFNGNPLFEYGEHGKPAIVGRPDIYFNLSHCREAVACAVSHHPIGIDVESVRSYHESVARYAMANNIPCEVSLENMMACGIGACLCCVEDTIDGHVCVCKEGPVFNTRRLKW